MLKEAFLFCSSSVPPEPSVEHDLHPFWEPLPPAPALNLALTRFHFPPQEAIPHSAADLVLPSQAVPICLLHLSGLLMDGFTENSQIGCHVKGGGKGSLIFN